MKILVTGGTGFIGSHLVPLLKERGHEVSVLSRQNTNNVESTLSNFQPEVAFHLAWEGLPDYSWPLCVKNLELGLKIYEALLQSGCQKIITAGTCWEYGDLKGKVSPKDLPQTMNTFASAKTGLRLMGESLAREKNVSFVWARLFFVYGPGQRETSLIPSLIQKIRNKQVPEIKNPNAAHDFIYVKDVAKALVLLAERDCNSNIVNVGSGELRCVSDVANCIWKVMQKGPAKITSIENGNFFWADIADLEKLGWKPEWDFVRGIRSTVQYANTN